MKTVGFIGLGTMGKPMVTNLLSKGYPVIVYNRTSDKTEEVAQLGADIAASPKDVTRECDVLITMLADEQALEHIYYGADGIFEGAHPRLTVIDCSTVSPSTSKRLYQDFQARAVDFLDAPVTGSKPQAESGTLVFIVGGQEEIVAEHQEMLLAMGKNVIHMGESGAGSQTKLAHNTIVGIHLSTLSEGLSLVAKAGVDVEKFLEVVQSGGANSRMAEMKGDKILHRDFSNQFALKLMLKDLNLSTKWSEELGVPTPLLQTAVNQFQKALDDGYGELDASAVVHSYEKEINQTITPISETDEPIGIERRTNTRVPMNIKLRLSVHQWQQEGSYAGQSIEGTLYDISSGGLQIVSETPLAMDMFVVIHFPEDAKLPPITGKIIRIIPKNNKLDAFSYGCMLSGLAPYTRVKLEAYIQEHVDRLEGGNA